MPPKPTPTVASAAASQRDKRRNRFFEAISTTPAPNTKSSQPMPPLASAPQSKAKKAAGKKSKTKEFASDSSDTMRVEFRLPHEASKLFEKIANSGGNSLEAVEELMKQVRADFAADPCSNGVIGQDDLLKVIKASAHMAMQARAEGTGGMLGVGSGIKGSLGDIVSAPRESLPPALQKAQDDLIDVEELRAKTDMPLSHDPKVRKRYINNMLRINGEEPFPFGDLTQYRDPNTAMGRYIRYELPARGYMMELRARKPDLCEVLDDMLRVYWGRAAAVGGHIKTTR